MELSLNLADTPDALMVTLYDVRNDGFKIALQMRGKLHFLHDGFEVRVSMAESGTIRVRDDVKWVYSNL